MNTRNKKDRRSRRNQRYDVGENIVTRDEDGFEIEDEFDFETIKYAQQRELLMYLGFSEQDTYNINVNDRLVFNCYLDAIAQTYNEETFELDRKQELIQVLKAEGFTEDVLEEYYVKQTLNKNNEVISRLKGTVITPFRKVLKTIFLLLYCISILIAVIIAKQWVLGIIFAVTTLFSIFQCIEEWNKYQKSKKSYGNIYKMLYKFKISNVVFGLGIIMFIFAMILIWIILREALTPNDCLFYKENFWSNITVVFVSFIYLEMLINFIIGKVNVKKERITMFKASASIDSFSSKHIGKFTYLYFMILFLCSMSCTYVNEAEIICCTPFNWVGKHYKLEDVDMVKASFGSKGYSLKEGEQKGDFCYEVFIGEKKIKFVNIIENFDDNICAYEVLDRVDRAIMSCGAEKSSDDTHKENIEDKKDREICLKIVNRR